MDGRRERRGREKEGGKWCKTGPSSVVDPLAGAPGTPFSLLPTPSSLSYFLLPWFSVFLSWERSSGLQEGIMAQGCTIVMFCT